MKILYLTFYFQPDLCAGSFRNTPLVKQLSKIIGSENSIHVITTMPNRYHSFTETALDYEVIGNIIINRISLPEHKSGFMDQALAFKQYFFEVFSLIKNQKYDMVFASSSRLFTAFLGSLVSKRKNIPFYLDIRDIFIDTLQDVIKNSLLKIILLPGLKIIEKMTFNQASHINLISEGFRPYFFKYKNPSFSYFTNGIDSEFLSLPPSSTITMHPLLITYAGNIGEGQGLEKIVPYAAKMLGSNYLFRIIGDGGKKPELKRRLLEENILNVELISPKSRDIIIQYYQESHYLFLHLNDYKAFEKVLPSKIFEYGATDKPIIAGVSGYAAKFIEENLSNYVIFPPGNADRMVSKIKNLTFAFEERKSFIRKYSRVKVNKQMAHSIMSICKK